MGFKTVLPRLIPHLEDGQVIHFMTGNFGSLILRRMMRKMEKKSKFAPIEPMVFYPAVIIVAIFGGLMALFPELSSTFVDIGYALVMQNMTAVLLMGGLRLPGCLSVAGFRPFRPGAPGWPGKQPGFSTFAWVSMMFCCGILI